MSNVKSCIAPRASVFLSPKTSSEIETEIIYGQGFLCRTVTNGFVEGEVIPLIADPSGPRSKGYVRVKELSELQRPPAYKVSALKAPVFAKKDIKSAIKTVLPFGARLSALSTHRNFIRIGRGQYIHHSHISAIEDYTPDFVCHAEKHMGLPYIWGGVSTDGLDCSGLVQSSLWAAGVPCPRNSGEQMQRLGRAVDMDVGFMRGDLVFWPGHVGIMRSDTHMIHANAHHMCTHSETLMGAIRRIEKTAGPIRAIKRLEG